MSARPEPAEEPVTITASMLARPEADSVDGGRIDFEDGMTYAPWATLTLLVAMVAVFAWEVSISAFSSRAAIIDAGALVRWRVLDGELWRLGSATFLHGSAEHLIGNCVSLYVLGMACEHAVGWRRTLTIFAAGAIGGWGLSLATHAGPTVGASGAIFGVMGAVVWTLHAHRETFVVRDKRIGGVVAIWAGYTLLIGALNPVIDNAAHLGGLVAGGAAAIGLPLRDHFRIQRLKRMPVGRLRVR